VKLFSSNIIDKLRNPLKQGISHNHKPGENLMATRKLSAHETSETPRCQAIASLVTPYEVKEGSKAKEGRRSKGTLNEPSEYPFTFLKESITA
jgi:hypothetical protein